MKSIATSFAARCGTLVAGSLTLIVVTASAFGQVSPTEVSNPRASANERKYLPQLVSLQRSIGTANFPFTFRLARYLDAKPGQRAALDSNGLEFVYFQQRVVLKVSGFYRVAFDSVKVNENGRATQALQEAVLPILRLITKEVPQNNDYDGIGFEILYDARDSSRSYDYEGREVLTIVFSRDDAFALANATSEEDEREILNRSDVFVNGKEFELDLGQRGPLNRDPLDQEKRERSLARPTVERASFTPAKPIRATVNDGISSETSDRHLVAVPASSPINPDVDRVQEVLQAQVTAIRSGDVGPLRSPDKAPSFETMGDQQVLHFTIQNTLSFDRDRTSIYKRAAQSFDLFLAPELKEFSNKVPADAPVDALAFSVLDHFGADKNAGETIEFICPVDSVRSFVENKITSQDLVNKSTVLVNGLRIGLHLELVE